MQRRKFIRNSGLTLAALAFLTNRSFASFLDDPTWKIKMLNDKTGIFTEKGGTILFTSTKEGFVVVDSQFPDTSQHLIDELKKKAEQPFRLLINTHHHADHSSGNISYKGLVKRVLAHENSKKNQEAVAIQKKNEDQQLYPDQTYGTTWCEPIGEEEICLHYFGPGHTNGDSVVQFKKANVVHMGDLVFNRRHPYIDRSTGANIQNWILILDKVVEKFNNKTKFVCGHAGEGYGVELTKADLKAFKNYLEKVLAFTAAAIKDGKSKEELIKATEIPGAPEWKGDGIDRPLSAAYDELTTK